LSVVASFCSIFLLSESCQRPVRPAAVSEDRAELALPKEGALEERAGNPRRTSHNMAFTVQETSRINVYHRHWTCVIVIGAEESKFTIFGSKQRRFGHGVQVVLYHW
jgi:hypothetical protein